MHFGFNNIPFSICRTASKSNLIRNLGSRSFVPPVRDEESETQRKAHAKRVRETRRSTQGVTLEEIKSAEQLVKKNQQANNNNNNNNQVSRKKLASKCISEKSFIAVSDVEFSFLSLIRKLNSWNQVILYALNFFFA